MIKKSIFMLSIITVFTIVLTACSNEKPLTEAEQAAEMNMTLEEYQEMKAAAARMNMTIDEHANMDEDMEMEDMDM